MAKGLWQGKTQADREGSRTVEECTCGITRCGITTHGHLAQHKGWPWAYTRVLDLASGAPPPGISTGFAKGKLTEKQKKRTYPVRRGEWHSKRDWHRVGLVLLAICGMYTGGHGLYMEIIKSCKLVSCHPAGSSTDVCYRGAPHQCPRGRHVSHRVCSHTEGAW